MGKLPMVEREPLLGSGLESVCMCRRARGGGMGSEGGLHQGAGGICTPSRSYAKMFQKIAKRRKVMKENTMTHQEHCFCRLSS